MTLAEFIHDHMELILKTWEEFTKSCTAGAHLDPSALRDQTRQILEAICEDIVREQTRDEEVAKSNGMSPSLSADQTAAHALALMRARSGFEITNVAAEYRALRASVLRLWIDHCAPAAPNPQEMMRFNEAIDQALSESVTFFSAEVDRARNLLLGILGHDMRTPLGAIQMTAQYLKKLNAGEEVSVAAGRLIRSGALIKGLLDDLTEFNRSQLGLGISVRVADSDLRTVFEDELQQIRVAYPQCDVILTCDGDVRSNCDSRRLQQLLGNLVVNAFKYGQAGKPVRVALKGSAEEIVFRVENDGQQIPNNALPELFDPLRRGPDRPQAEGSLGLGLYICREIAHAHQGTITAESGASVTAFTVHIPRDCHNNVL